MPGCSRTLATHLFDDGTGGTADGLDGHRGEQADHHAAEDQANQDGRVADLEGLVVVMQGKLVAEAREEDDRSKHSDPIA